MSQVQALERHTLLARLLGLACQQHAALLDEDIEAFLALMPERATIIAGLAGTSDAPRPANIVPIHASVDEDTDLAIRALLASVLHQDEANALLLRGQMEGVREALAGIARWYSAAQGYTAALAGRSNGAMLDIAS
jgi:hypothetical protein